VGAPSAITSAGSATAAAAAAASFSAALKSWDGVLVFDECHKAKNFTPGKEAQSTKVCSCVQHPCSAPCCVRQWVAMSLACRTPSTCDCGPNPHR
jgi:hypothetical protein